MNPLLDKNIDTLILGCTHYPLLKQRILDITEKITLVDSSTEIAHLVMDTLKILNILSPRKDPGTIDVFLSDAHPDFAKWSKELLGKEIFAHIFDGEQYGSCL